MHARGFFRSTSVALLSLSALTFAYAQTSPADERQKMHVVSRLYQATYGAQERCRPSSEASASLEKSINQLRRAFPDLLGLIDASPYLPQAREQFKTALSNAPATNDDSLAQECKSIEYMLRQLVESPGGQEAANDMIATLKK